MVFFIFLIQFGSRGSVWQIKTIAYTGLKGIKKREYQAQIDMLA